MITNGFSVGIRSTKEGVRLSTTNCGRDIRRLLGKNGEDSVSYRYALPGESGHTNGRFEAPVVEQIVTEMIRKEPSIKTGTSCYSGFSRKKGGTSDFHSVRCDGGRGEKRTTAKVYADCSYEGDLKGVVGVSHRLGRKSVTNSTNRMPVHLNGRIRNDDPEKESRHRHWEDPELALFRSPIGYPERKHGAGRGDNWVQAYNMRMVLSSDLENRILPDRPPNYSPERMKELDNSWTIRLLPNSKVGWNRPRLLETSTLTPMVISRRESASSSSTLGGEVDAVRERCREFGFARDEFVENANFPCEIYVRKMWRIVGRAIFTQYKGDAHRSYRSGLLQGDCIAFIE